MLKFKNISNNDDYKDELNNCVVIALTEVTNDNFCYNTIKFFVRHVMNRTKNNSVLYGEILGAKKLFKNIELNYKKIKISSKETLKTFGEKNNTGKYLLIVDGHMTALINGYIHDTYFDEDQKLLYAIKVD